MTYKKIKYILLLSLMVFASCQEEDNTTIEPKGNAETINSEISNKYRLLDISPNVYHDYFKITDNTIGFNNLKPNGKADYSLAQQIEVLDPNNKSVSLNNQKMVLGENNKASDFNQADIYGRTISVNIMGNKSSNNPTEVKLYIPKKLNVSKPVLQTDTKTSILAYYKNFLLEWNADSKNEEGLMVAVEYFGETIGDEDEVREHIQNVDHIENDNGKYVLKSAMFEGIPNLSFINIVLLRGNIDISEIDGESYKTYAESHQRIPILLVKDLISVKSINE